jgi:hypothetical protein
VSDDGLTDSNLQIPASMARVCLYDVMILLSLHLAHWVAF